MKKTEMNMKRYAVLGFLCIGLLASACGQTIDKSRYKEISLADYLAAGKTKERTDTELFKMEAKFLLQAANSVAVQTSDLAMHRFASETQLDFERGAELVLYIRATHSADGYWETERIDLAESP
jgi:hypothetical protein